MDEGARLGITPERAARGRVAGRENNVTVSLTAERAAILKDATVAGQLDNWWRHFQDVARI